MLTRKSILLAAIAAAAMTASTNAALTTAGDLSFTAFNADEDGWAMVALASISPNTTVYFTDNEYVSGAFNTGESYHQWVSGAAAIPAGTVVRFSAIDNATTLASSVGTLTRATVSGSTNYGMSQTADTVYAYLGSGPTSPSTFLSAVSSGVFGTAADGELTGTGLTIGAGAVQLSASSDYAEYSGIRSGQTSFGAYLSPVSTIGNWTDSGDGVYAANVPNTAAFTIVPEPASLGLIALAGLASVRRRRAM